MRKYQMVELADKWLKSIPDLKNNIMIIDQKIKKSGCDSDELEKLNYELMDLKRRLNSIARAIEKAGDVEQRIICYRYIDKLTYKVIGQRTGCHENTILRKLNNDIPLRIGRTLFGMEDEFWNELGRGIQ